MGLGLHKMEEKLQEYKYQFRTLFQNANQGVFLLSLTNDNLGFFIETNDVTCSWLGYTREELLKLTIKDVIVKKYRSEALAKITTLIKNKFISFETCLLAKSGLTIRVEFNSHIVIYDGTSFILTIVWDISGRKKIEEEFRNVNQEFMDIIDFLPDATFVIDRTQKVIAWNHAIEEMTGLRKEEIIGKGNYEYSEVFYGKRKPILINMVGTVLENVGDTTDYKYIERRGETLYGEVFAPRLNKGKGAFLWVKASPLYDRNQQWVGAIETLHDLTERKQMEQQVKYLGAHDQLTGLYARAFLEQEMNQLIKNNGNLPIGIILCDIDGFKTINDNFGHDIGDKLLISTANLIKSSVYENGIVARVGGDGFAAFLWQSNRIIVESTVKRIRGAITDYNAGHPELPISISIGYAISNELELNMDLLFKIADENMNREKLYRRQSPRSNIIQTLLAALRERDFDTEGHASRLQKLVIALGDAISLPERTLTDLRLFAQFHDIGKVGIPDRLLLKNGSFTPEEVIEMQKHCEIGFRIAQASSELRPIADWIYKHHEWWNGKGYPLGLKGEEIPLECRILAIVDAFDAMTNDRPYRKALTYMAAKAELQKWAGVQFDQELVTKFLNLSVIATKEC